MRVFITVVQIRLSCVHPASQAKLPKVGHCLGLKGAAFQKQQFSSFLKRDCPVRSKWDSMKMSLCLYELKLQGVVQMSCTVASAERDIVH